MGEPSDRLALEEAVAAEVQSKKLVFLPHQAELGQYFIFQKKFLFPPEKASGGIRNHDIRITSATL